MKRSFIVMLVAVLLPALLLGWLALRGAEEQQIVLERRTAELYQKETDNVATAARSLVSEQRRVFAETVHGILAEGDPRTLAVDFTANLAKRWPRKAVGFVVDRGGRLICPTTRDANARVDCKQFLWENGGFIGNKTVATVYPVAIEDLNRPELATRKSSLAQNQYGQMGKSLETAKAAELKAAPSQAPAKAASGSSEGFLALKDGAPAPQKEEAAFRNVAPQQQVEPADSQLTWATADFGRLTEGADEGLVNRFVQDRLDMIFWIRPAEARNLVFGCLIQADDLHDLWSGVFPPPAAPASRGGPDFRYLLALLDDKAHPVALLPPGRKAPDWKQPFVASEIGEALPHWEAALYLLHPELLQESVKSVRRTLYLLTASALAAIACGGWIVIADTRRQLLLAQKKTDFVSNVSHELKTPLTSIRMFAEMMLGGRTDPEKQTQYLRIIMVEAERLTRLINNVLDFARIERRQKRLHKRPLDLHTVIEQVWQGQELHLKEAGFAVHWEAAAPPYPIIGDDDALAQVLVNLLSNAEKYSGDRKEVALQSFTDGGSVFVSVLDRGLGLPAGEEKKIFEPFYRAHDSLSSGIPGTGLGLSLARRLVEEHGGEIIYQPRTGGGSNFTMRLPLAPVQSS